MDEPLDIGRKAPFSAAKCEISASEKQPESKERKQEHTSAGRGMSHGPSFSKHVENLQQLVEQIGMKSDHFHQANEDHETLIFGNRIPEDHVMGKRKSSGECMSKSGPKSFKSSHSASNRKIEDTEKSNRVADCRGRTTTELICLKASTITGESSSYNFPETQGPSVIRAALPFFFHQLSRGFREYSNLNIHNFPEFDMQSRHLFKSGVSNETEYTKSIENSKVTFEEERLKLGIVSHTIKGNDILEHKDSNVGFRISSEITHVPATKLAAATNNDFESSSYTNIQDKMRKSNVSLYSENATNECICHRTSTSFAQCMCRIPPMNAGASCNYDSSVIGHSRYNVQTVPFVCKLCGICFSLLSDLETHLRICLLRCKLCNRRFATKYTLGIHIRRHKNYKPFQCNDCKKAFVTNFELLSHIANHTGRKKFKCDYCKKGFWNKYDLKLHIRRHNNDRPFVCNDCGKRFATKRELKYHFTIHTGKSDFKCEYCAKYFARKADFAIHIRRHTGDRPFVCNVCNSAFCSSSDLKKHFRTHTR